MKPRFTTPVALQVLVRALTAADRHHKDSPSHQSVHLIGVDAVNLVHRLICIAWLSFLCSISTVEATQPSTSITASFVVASPYKIKTAIKTNLPDGATVGISLRFNSKNVNDPALGLNLHKAKVLGGRASLVVDQSQATTTIPRGSYKIRVFYSPFFPENRAYVLKGLKKYAFFESTIQLIGDNVEYSEIRNSDQAYEQASKIFSELPYKTTRSEMLAKFRIYGNPSISKMSDSTGNGTAYYYRSIDATLVIYQSSGYQLRRGRFYR